jgi:hypothetical protein
MKYFIGQLMQLLPVPQTGPLGHDINIGDIKSEGVGKMGDMVFGPAVEVRDCEKDQIGPDPVLHIEP